MAESKGRGIDDLRYETSGKRTQDRSGVSAERRKPWNFRMRLSAESRYAAYPVPLIIFHLPIHAL
jgi:hypothetical protein